MVGCYYDYKRAVRSSRQSVRTWTANDTHIQTKMLKWPIRERKAVNRSGYGYGGKRVNPTNLALDGRKLVDYSSSDDSPPNDVDDSPTSLPRKMLRLHYGPAQGHVEWTPVDEHQPSSSLMFPSSTYRVCCNMNWTVSATRKCTRDEFDNLVARRDVDGIVKVHGVSSHINWL